MTRKAPTLASPYTTLLAIDPSVRAPGLALFRDGALAHVFAPSIMHKHSEEGAKVCDVARVILAWVAAKSTIGPQTIVGEWPQIYRAAKSKGDPNDLIALAAIVTAVASHYPHAQVITPTPDEWIGSIPKVVPGAARATKAGAFASPRGRLVMTALDEQERPMVPQSHDAVDAVGIGLWALGRLYPARIYPGAT